MKNKTEILAPVGGEEQLLAAVRNGADAVYLGLKDFNARVGAANFGEEEFINAVRYCKGAGVKVYVTLNTLIKDSETYELVKIIKFLSKCGVDAFIVQDLAVAELVKRYSTVDLHASTQMSVHNQSGADALIRLGFKRVVLAREMTLEQIRAIKGIEKEVFVHGALCMSFSGQCRLSAFLGQRSANRGRCAQPCRLNFKCGSKEYALSLKDLSYVEHLPLLAEAGVCSFKIEGRKKRPEYVAAAVSACKKVLDGEKADTCSLKAVFSRSGFTDGYLYGKKDKNMFGYRRKEDVEAQSTVLSSLRNSYKGEIQKIPVNMTLILKSKCPASLAVSDGENRVIVSGDEPIKNVSFTDEQNSEKFLQKTGDTVFYLRSLKVENEDKLYLKASHINAMRREALALLFEERSKLLDKSKETPENAEDESFLPCKAERIKLRLSYENVDAISVFASEKADEIIVNAKDIKAALSKVDKSKLIGKLPEIEYDDLKMRGLIREMRSLGVDKVLCENIGAVYMAREEGMCIFGGSGLNVINSLSLNAYADMGVVEMTLSTECDRGILLNIKGRIKTGIVAYGYLPVMYMNACPNISSGCARCSGINKISGRKGEDLFTYCHSRKYVTLHNGVKLYVLDKLSDIPNLSHAVLAFTKENESECDGVIRSFLKREIPEGDFTRGIYFKTLI